MVEPVMVMKKGYRVAMIIGISGFVGICYAFLNHNGSWFAFSMCGLVGVIIAYIFIEMT